MSGPSTKRRKPNEGILFKPFKSPMKTSTIQPPTDTDNKINTNTTIKAQPTDIPTRTAPKWTLPVQGPVQGLSESASSELSALRREESRLLAQLSKLRSELDQVKQARRIESSARDRELLDLTKLWRSASQQAAEEIYATMRDRVNSDGGMRRWRERERERRENAWQGWGAEDEGRRAGNDDGGECEDGDENRDEREDAGAEGAADEDEEREQAGVEESESFSMDVMLRYFNIGLDVIGYDVEEQRWVT